MKLRIFLCATIITMLLSACGTTSSIKQIEPGINQIESTPTPILQPTFSAVSQYMLPSYYSQYYNNSIEASKQEPGLIIYSDMTSQSWAQALEGFHARYPWIKVTATDLESSEVFDKYSSEEQAQQARADILISSDVARLQETLSRGEIFPYRSQEEAYIPVWSKLGDGIYAVSSDPMILIYNKTMVQSPPETMEQLTKLIQENPGRFWGQITVLDAELNGASFDTNWFWIKTKGESGWQTLSAIGTTKPNLLTSGARMVDAVNSGRTMIGYFAPAISVFPKLNDSPNLGWSYIKDGQPIVIRGIGITQRGSSQNSAKLLVDYLLSQEGQLALSYGGLIPLRSDVYGISEYHLQNIISDVGEQNIILMTYDPDIAEQTRRDEFITRWKTTFGKQ